MKRGKTGDKPTIGIIAGSGLYQMEGLTNVTEVRVGTPFGQPSDALVIGDLEGTRVAFLARHGRHHRLSPSEINYRANIYALKKIGAERIVSVSAVGSMKESLQPGEVVIPHQFLDQTKRRISTFFESGVVAHVAMADPVCPDVAEKLAQAQSAANKARQDELERDLLRKLELARTGSGTERDLSQVRALRDAGAPPRSRIHHGRSPRSRD